MEKNNLTEQHANNLDSQAHFEVPFDVHGTDASALGGTSPEMIKLSQFTTKGTRRH